ncbi:DUF6894 family protein [Rhizobium leguminosarum]|uniref:DUF6894 family protein n=1 Tax=Rhizobium leguminosarum TaxID=384 RepID=UPI003F95DECC
MPKFYLHIARTDCSVLDPEGREYPNLDAATEEAIESLRELIVEALLCKRSAILLGIVICTESGTMVREVSVDRAIPEVARSLQMIWSKPSNLAAGRGTVIIAEG